MYSFFFVLSVIFSGLCFLNFDPMKSSLYLILSLLTMAPLMSFINHVLFSYFICLLFLSGIFVILVYFSSLSKINFFKSGGTFLSLILTFILCWPTIIFFDSNLGMMSFYLDIYIYLVLFIIFMLILFMNFCSYYLNFSGALRSV